MVNKRPNNYNYPGAKGTGTVRIVRANKYRPLEMEEILDELAIKFPEFIRTLTDEDREQLSNVNKLLLARFYQAGAIFAIEMLEKLEKES